MRKDELIKRHYEKIAMWQNLLADIQSQGWAKSPAQGQMPPSAMSNGQGVPPQPPGVTQLQMQQQMQQAQQLQHQQQMHQQMQQQMQQQVLH